MKHIYIVDEHQSSKQNGVGTYIQQLLKCFEGSGHDVNLLSFNSDEKEFMVEGHSSYTEYHFPICGIGSFLRNGQLSLPVFRIYVDDSKDNVIFVNHSPCSMFLRTIKKLFPLSRLLFVIHDQGWCAPLLGDVELFKKIITTKYIPKQNEQKWQMIRRSYYEECRMYSIANDIVSLAEETSILLQRTYKVPDKKIHQIPNGLDIKEECTKRVDINGLRGELGLSNEEKVMLYAGRTVESKGIIPLLLSFESLYKLNHNIRLVIAGRVYQLNDFAKHTRLSSTHITYLGFIKESQMKKWYKVADVCVLPSYTEQCSYFGIEMLAHGKSIVVVEGHNMDEMFNDNCALKVARVKNFEQQAELLFNMFSSVLKMTKETCLKYQKEARLQYKKKYTLKQMRYAYMQLIAK